MEAARHRSWVQQGPTGSYVQVVMQPSRMKWHFTVLSPDSSGYKCRFNLSLRLWRQTFGYLSPVTQRYAKYLSSATQSCHFCLKVPPKRISPWLKVEAIIPNSGRINAKRNMLRELVVFRSTWFVHSFSAGIIINYHPSWMRNEPWYSMICF